jgi:hypothetical protein
MTEENPKEQIVDLHIRIPPDLAKRVRTFASENNYTVEGVAIEALDIFLREQKEKNKR